MHPAVIVPPFTASVLPSYVRLDCPVTLLDVPLDVTKFPDVVEPPIDNPGP